MLSDRDIRRLMADGELVMRRASGRPLDDVQFQPNSIDVHLGRTFVINPWDKEYKHTYELGGDKVVCQPGPIELPEGATLMLAPGQFVLATTDEWIELSAALAARIEGVSSMARAGIINQIAPLIPAGFKGNITLEVYNATPVPVPLRVGAKIGQITIESLSSPALRPYGHEDLKSKYQGQSGATTARAEGDSPPASTTPSGQAPLVDARPVAPPVPCPNDCDIYDPTRQVVIRYYMRPVPDNPRYVRCSCCRQITLNPYPHHRWPS